MDPQPVTHETLIQERLHFTEQAMVMLAQALKRAISLVLHEPNPDAMTAMGVGVCGARLLVLLDGVHTEVHRQKEAIRAANELLRQRAADAAGNN